MIEVGTRRKETMKQITLTNSDIPVQVSDNIPDEILTRAWRLAKRRNSYRIESGGHKDTRYLHVEIGRFLNLTGNVRLKDSNVFNHRNENIESIRTLEPGPQQVPEVLEEGCKIIALTQGRVTWVSGHRYEILMARGPWQYAKSRDGRDGYAKRSAVAAEADPDCQSVMMHKLLAHWLKQESKQGSPDHIDRYKLNNQDSNLRPSTVAQQNVNRGVLCTNSSGINGTSPIKEKGVLVGYRAYTHSGNKKIDLGSYRGPSELLNECNMQGGYAHDFATAYLKGEDANGKAFAWANPNIHIGDEMKREIELDVLWRLTGGEEGASRVKHCRGADQTTRAKGGGRPKGSKNKPACGE